MFVYQEVTRREKSRHKQKPNRKVQKEKDMKYMIMAALALFAGSAALNAEDLAAGQFGTFYASAPVKNVVDVPVTQDIRDWFTRHQVDGTLIDSPTASVNVKLDIDRVLVNGDPIGTTGSGAGETTTHVNQTALEALIRPALAAALKNGAEEARMAIGDQVWELRG